MAFLLLLERLTPVERAAFLLHDVFGYGYDELARVVSKRRSKLSADRPSRASARHRKSSAIRRGARTARLLREFMAATSLGDLRSLVSVLSDEVVLYADGGGKANAARRPVHGTLNVARFVLGAIAKSVPKDVSVDIEIVNGQPSVVYRLPQGPAGCVLSVVANGEQIWEILVVTNPDKLAHISTRS